MIGHSLGHYTIVEKIGAGGMGEVYRAHDEHLDRDVALKVLPLGTLHDEPSRKQFRIEALALSKLNHRNIATVHDFDTDNGVDFLVMEYIVGSKLDVRLAQGALSEKSFFSFGIQILAALDEAHEKSVIHRDLKPSNIIVSPKGQLKVLDFGLAKMLRSVGDLSTTDSDSLNRVVGTLPYMAPEQLRSEPIDVRSDIYAAGVVLYEMATGRRPFLESNGPKLIEAILHQKPEPPSRFAHHVSPALDNVVLKALDKHPERRYQSARELQVDLQRLCAASPPSTASLENRPEKSLEVAHLLFMDLVAYSTQPMDQQRHLLGKLEKIVCSTSQFIRAKCSDQLIPLPTGDGMALVFFGDPEAPMRCALELSRALRNEPDVKLRMGLHTGPVYRVADINANRNVAGGGINVAQRVMDCGDANHILASKAVVDILGDLREWADCIHDLGETEVKHGMRLHLYNIYTDNAGNTETPQKIRNSKRKISTGTGKRPRVVRAAPIPVPKLEDTHSNPSPAVVSEVRQDSLPVVPVQAKRVRHLGWIAVVSSLLLIAAAAQHWLFPPPSADESGIPARGKYLAVLPLNVKGDSNLLDPVAQTLSNGLSRRLLTVRGMNSVLSSAATGTVALQGEVDLTRSPTNVASQLKANLLLQGTLTGAADKIFVGVKFHNVLDHHSATSDFSGPASDLDKIADQISAWTIEKLTLDKKPDKWETNPVAADEVQKFRSFYKAFADAHPEQAKKSAKQAIDYYQNSVSRNPHSALSWAGLAAASVTMFLNTGDRTWTQKAVDAAQHAQGLEINLLPEAYVAIGDAYRYTGKADEAIGSYTRALQIAPNDEVWRRLAQIYAGSGKATQALMAAENALTIDPDNSRNHLQLGLTYYSLGNYSRALAAFRRVVELDPDSFVGHKSIGAVYLQQAKYEESIPESLKALRTQPDAEVYSNLGTAYFYVKRYAEAIKMNEKAVAMVPNEEALVGNLADSYRCSGNIKKANETYEKAISLAAKALESNPRDPRVVGDLALFYAQKGDAPLADHYIRQARLIDPSDPDLLYQEAQVRILANDPAQAMKSLRSALEKGKSAETAKLEPEFAKLRDSAEFVKLINEFQHQAH